MVSSTREGAELLSQYGWESRWNTRAERWPLVEDHSMLLDNSMDEDYRSEMGFSMGSSRLELGSPSSNLDFIAEEQFKIAGGKVDFSMNEEEEDEEGGIMLSGLKPKSLTYSPELIRRGQRLKARTLPLSAKGVRGLHLPNRAQTFRSVALHNGVDRTRSVEHISSGGHREEVISRDQRSLSFNLDDKFSAFTNNKDSSSVINNNIECVIDKNVGESANVPSLTVSSKPSSSVDTSEKCDLSVSECVTSDLSSSPTCVVNSEASVSEVTDISTATAKSPEEEVADICEQSDIVISVTDTDGALENDSCVTELNNSNGLVKESSGKSNEDISSQEQKRESSDTDLKQSVRDENERAATFERLHSTESDDSYRRPTLKAQKEERSSSSESSRTTSSKSRAESFTTDTTTSGIGSYDSGHHGVTELPSLSPIASTNSLDMEEVVMRHPENRETRDSHLHHSLLMRRMSNLTRVPSIKRQSSPSVHMQPSAKYFDFSESAIMYTTARDALGYATLRNLMKTRQISMDMESDYGINNLYESFGSTSSLARRSSIDSTALQRPSR